jgi:nucleoside-diphosphate-sugar epimerase
VTKPAAAIVGIVGVGWLGLPVARRLATRFKLWGTCRTPEKADGLSPLFETVIVFDSLGDRPSQLNQAPPTSTLLITIPPGGNTQYAEHIVRIVDQVGPEHGVVFTSSVSVYGDRQGQVDEQSVCEPTSESGKMILAAEERLRQEHPGRLVLLRLGGLLGEDRHPVTHMAGRKRPGSGNEPVNLVQRSDAVEACVRAVTDSRVEGVFNIVSPHHPTRQHFYTAAALARGLAAPLFTDSDTTDADGKIVNSTRNLLSSYREL